MLRAVNSFLRGGLPTLMKHRVLLSNANHKWGQLLVWRGHNLSLALQNRVLHLGAPLMSVWLVVGWTVCATLALQLAENGVALLVVSILAR